MLLLVSIIMLIIELENLMYQIEIRSLLFAYKSALNINHML